MLESWRANRVLEHDRVDTIADGIGVRVPILEAVQDMQTLVDDGVTVTDAQMLSAMRNSLEGLGILLEPSGAAGLAAAYAHRSRFRGKRIATVLYGGNVTKEQFQTWFV